MLSGRFPAIFGALVLALFAASLPFGARLAADTSELSVTLAAEAPHEIAPWSGAALAPAVAGPPSLLGRLERAGEPDSKGPGLALRTWQVTYGRRWERSVTSPLLTGPFDPEGTPWPCSIAVRLGPRFFDDGKPGGEDVEAVVDRVVRAQFPIEAHGMRFARVRSTSLHVRPAEGAIEISGGVTLADGGAFRDPTHFQIKARIALGERNGDLAAKLEDVAVSWTGNTRRDPLVQLADIFMDVDAQARSMVEGRLRGALSILHLPKAPFPIFDDRPGDTLTVRLCGPPVSHPDGLTVSLRVIANLAEPRIDPSIPGPAHLDAPPDIAKVAWDRGDPAPVEAVATTAAAQQALYLLWQSGALSRWGRRRDVVSSMQRKLDDRLSFDVTAIDPRLPPVVSPDGEGAFRVRFGDLGLGRFDDGRSVVANGDILATARIDGGSLGLSGTLDDLRVSCVDGAPGRWTLRPCLSDVVPVLRDSGMTSQGIPLDLTLPDRLLRMNLVLGTELVLEGMEAETRGSPPALHVRARARLVRKKP